MLLYEVNTWNVIAGLLFPNSTLKLKTIRKTGWKECATVRETIVSDWCSPASYIPISSFKPGSGPSFNYGAAGPRRMPSSFHHRPENHNYPSARQPAYYQRCHSKAKPQHLQLAQRKDVYTAKQNLMWISYGAAATEPRCSFRSDQTDDGNFPGYHKAPAADKAIWCMFSTIYCHN